jgi:hypothetical protein
LTKLPARHLEMKKKKNEAEKSNYFSDGKILESRFLVLKG